MEEVKDAKKIDVTAIIKKLWPHRKKYFYVLPATLIIVNSMNGTVAKVSDGAKVRPGCEIVVPQKAMNRKMGVAEYLAIGSTAAAIATMGATIGNLLK